jgi:mannosyltransferase OCH1-like enzyme|uniref:Glycosyltransferase n=1 Tax=viral metagenome TaxID=1070528 RepID=A0A6C0E2J4_9ZZZZ
MLKDEYTNNTNNTFPIPKIIHTSFKTYESIPKEYNEVFKSWKTTNPDWEVKFYSYNDNDIMIKKNFPWLYDTYNNFYFDEQRLDMAKACYLYLYGGLYVDVNYLPLANIDPLFYNSNDELYFAYNNNAQNSIVTSFMGSKPKSSFWLTYLKNIIGDKGFILNTKYGIINSTTGSQKFTDLLESYNGTVGKLPYNDINSCTECNENCNQSFYFHVINNGNINGRFFSDIDVVLFKFIYCFLKKNWFLITFTIFIAIIVFFIYLWLTYKTVLMIPTFLFFIYKKITKNANDIVGNVKKEIGDNVSNLSHFIKKSPSKQSKKKEKKE